MNYAKRKHISDELQKGKEVGKFLIETETRKSAKFVLKSVTLIDLILLEKVSIKLDEDNLTELWSNLEGDEKVKRRPGKEDGEGRRRGSAVVGERRDGDLAVAETKERAADPALRQAIFGHCKEKCEQREDGFLLGFTRN